MLRVGSDKSHTRAFVAGDPASRWTVMVPDHSSPTTPGRSAQRAAGATREAPRPHARAGEDGAGRRPADAQLAATAKAQLLDLQPSAQE
jgi:hypothetical protein